MTTKTVLVVEDEAAIAEAVRARLQSEGYRVLVEGDGPTAIETTARERPDLVVLDLMLPGMDGLEVCRRLREHSAIPVVMLTALGEEENRIAGLQLGADDYVTKPFSPRELALRVSSVLRRARTPATQSGPPVNGASRARVTRYGHLPRPRVIRWHIVCHWTGPRPRRYRVRPPCTVTERMRNP